MGFDLSAIQSCLYYQLTTTFALASHQTLKSMKLFQKYHYNLLLNESKVFYETEPLYCMSVCVFVSPSKYHLFLFFNLHASPPPHLHVNVIKELNIKYSSLCAN